MKVELKEEGASDVAFYYIGIGECFKTDTSYKNKKEIALCIKVDNFNTEYNAVEFVSGYLFKMNPNTLVTPINMKAVEV